MLPFYNKLNDLLYADGFDSVVEDLCRAFYHETLGRPSLPLAVAFACC